MVLRVLLMLRPLAVTRMLRWVSVASIVISVILSAAVLILLSHHRSLGVVPAFQGVWQVGGSIMAAMSGR